MTISPESLKEQDYTKQICSLIHKATNHKKRHCKLAAQIEATKAPCKSLLHFEISKRND